VHLILYYILAWVALGLLAYGLRSRRRQRRDMYQPPFRDDPLPPPPGTNQPPGTNRPPAANQRDDPDGDGA
jgi:hypothetical protein